MPGPAPAIGRIVHFKTRLASLKFNQALEETATHPAVITRVHDENLLDLTVFYNGSAPQPKNAVSNVDTEHSWWCWPEKY